MTAEASVHLPLSLCFTNTFESFIVAAIASIESAGSIVITSASASTRLNRRFFIVPSVSFIFVTVSNYIPDPVFVQGI